MLCPVYGHELTPLSCPPHQGVSFRSFKGLIILSPYMDFTSMPAHGSLAGYRNLFLHWSANLYFGFFRWVAPQVEKGVVSLGAVHAEPC